MSTTTEAATAATSTRTRTRRKRDRYQDAAAAARLAQRKLAELNPKGPGPAMVLLGIVAEITLYSRLNDQLGIDRLVEVTGLDRRTVQRAVTYLVNHGIIERIVPPREEGRPTPRAWIGFPWPPMDAADAARETPETLSTGERGEGGAADTLGGGAPDTPPRSTSEKKEEVSVGSKPSFARAREVGRSWGPTSRSQSAEPQRPLLPAAPRTLGDVIELPAPRTLTAEQERENQQLLAEIERRRALREAQA